MFATPPVKTCDILYSDEQAHTTILCFTLLDAAGLHLLRSVQRESGRCSACALADVLLRQEDRGQIMLQWDEVSRRQFNADAVSGFKAIVL